MSQANPIEAPADAAAGPAHVAVVSFLASRAAPSGGFFIALAGGTALARVSQRLGARAGYGASIAAVLETVAIIGPIRFSVPFTQAVTAPMLGRFEARGVRPALQVLACTFARMLLNLLGVVFFVAVIAGGLETYAATYDALVGRFGFELGEAGTVALTAFFLVAWGVFASVVQVAIYRRGLADWPDDDADAEPEPTADPRTHRGRYDPRAVALAAAVAFGLLLAGTSWPLLALAAGWLAIAWSTARPDGRAVPTGLVLAGVLAGGALVFSFGGGLGIDEALRRALRAALLVLVATWLRAAAGAEGLREVSRRALGRLRRVPAMHEAAVVLDRIGSEGRLWAAGRAFADALRGVEKRAVPLIEAVLGWVAREAGRYRPAPLGEPPLLRGRPIDGLVVLSAAVPALALLGVV